MAASLDVNVTLRGGLFKKDLNRVVKSRIVATVLGSVERRLLRGGRGITEQLNVTTTDIRDLTLSAAFTKRGRRRTGKAKQRKQVAQTRAIARNSANKASREIAQELSRG